MAANWLYDALFKPHAADTRPFLSSAAGTPTTYADFLAEAAVLAHTITAAGIHAGDRVAVQAEKSQAALALYTACVQTGAIYLPLNTAYTPGECGYFIKDAEPKLIVCDPGAEAALRPLAEDCSAGLLTLDSSGRGTLADQAGPRRADFETAARGKHDPAAILYTSGTTGRSKGAVLSHDNLLSNALTLKELWHFTGDDVLLHALPIYHVHGLFVATNVMLAAGGAMIFLPKFDAAEIVRRMPEATAMMGVPTYYSRLIANPAFTRETAQNMRLFISGSAPLLPATFAAFEARTGHRILERYGMTETGMITSNPYRGERRAGSVGPPLPGVSVRVGDQTSGVPLRTGQTGVIEVRGPNVFAGYWRRPDLQASEFRSDGYFITGDLAAIDAEGYVFISGRAKDLIITGGLNVYPIEIETIIDELDDVVDSAVFGVPHGDLGEAVAAAVAIKDGSALSAEAIASTLKGRLAGFKQPKAIFVVTELPRNTMGKVQKNVLRERYKAAFP